MKVKTSEIAVSDRMRKTYDDIEELAGSFVNIGQLQPILIDGEKNLIAGARRLQAAQYLEGEGEEEWAEIDVTVLKDADTVRSLLAQFIENSERSDFSWQEQSAAIRLIHETFVLFFKEQGESWWMEHTANVLGFSKGYVVESINVVDYIEQVPECSNEPSRRKAIMLYKKMTETIIRAELAQRLQEEKGGTVSEAIKDVKTEDFEKAAADLGYIKQYGHMIIKGSSLDAIPLLIEGGIKADVILTDPPFGKDYKGKGVTGATYGDSKEVFERVLETIGLFDQLLKPDGFILIFCSPEQGFSMGPIYDVLKKFTEVSRYPLIWDMDQLMKTDMRKWPSPSYGIITFARRGNKSIVSPMLSVLKSQPVAANLRLHTSEKPLFLMTKILSHLTYPGDVVIDPFAGSFVVVEAAASISRVGIGIDIDEDNFANGILRMKKKQYWVHMMHT